MCSKVQPIETNKEDLEEFEAKREAINKAHVVSCVNVSSGTISRSNVNLDKQVDVVKNVGSDFIKGVSDNFFKDVKENINQSVPSSDIIGGDMGGDGSDSYNGGFAGASGLAEGSNTFSYGKK